MKSSDLGYCNGCGNPLDGNARRGLCTNCQIDEEWHWANSSVNTVFGWLAARLRRLATRITR